MAWIAEQLLTAIRDDKVCDCVTEERLAMTTGLTAKQIENATNVLRRNGLLEKTSKGCHKLTSSGTQALTAGANVHSGPRGKDQSGKRVWKSTLRARIWCAIRLRRKFSVADIVPLVIDGSERGDVTSNVQKYIRALCKAGYLIKMPRREPGIALTSNGYIRYWMHDDKVTGPQAPVWSADKQRVYDPNTESTHDISKEAQPS